MDVKEILGHDLMFADNAYHTVMFDSDLKTLISIVDKRIRAAVEMRLDYVKIDTSNFHSRDIETVYYELCDYGYGVKTDSSYNLIITWNNKHFDKDYGEDDD